MTTKPNQTATEPRHWTDETADAAVQAAIEARALAWATARALGLPDENVEQAPRRAAELRAQLIFITRRDACTATHLAQIHAILAGLLADAGIEVTDDEVRLAIQVRARIRALEAERAVVVEALLATGIGRGFDDPVQLARQVAELVRGLKGVENE